jgi:hypothetical protein
MQVQNPVQAPIGFEAIAAKIVWQRCLAIDAWQIFYLAFLTLKLPPEGNNHRPPFRPRY